MPGLREYCRKGAHKSDLPVNTNGGPDSIRTAVCATVILRKVFNTTLLRSVQYTPVQYLPGAPSYASSPWHGVYRHS